MSRVILGAGKLEAQASDAETVQRLCLALQFVGLPIESFVASFHRNLA
jgi:hypothetical protein